MKNLLTARIAANGILAIISLTIVFHLMVLLEIIPFTIVWGGRLETKSEMLVFESISLAINLLILAITGIKAGILKISINPTAIKVILCILSVLFLINTVGNCFSTNVFEKLTFTPLTLILSILCVRLAISEEHEL